MLNFLFFCALLAFCLWVGGFVLNLLFMLVIGIFGAVMCLFEWVCNKFKGK